MRMKWRRRGDLLDKKKISADHLFFPTDSDYLHAVITSRRKIDLFSHVVKEARHKREISKVIKKKRATTKFTITLSHLATSFLNRPVGFCRRSVDKFQEISLHAWENRKKKERERERESGFLILVLHTCVSTCERNVEREKECVLFSWTFFLSFSCEHDGRGWLPNEYRSFGDRNRVVVDRSRPPSMSHLRDEIIAKFLPVIWFFIVELS